MHLEVVLDKVKLKYVVYNKAGIYQLRKRYLKEDTLGRMNHKNIMPQILDQNFTQTKQTVASFSYKIE